MILSFDKFERYELPQVTLCNPNSRATEVDGKITITDTVGVLSNPKGMSLKLNFNAPHELSFDYYRHKSTDPIKQSFYDNIYEAIQTDRYVYLTDIGYFIISNVSDSDEDNIDKKSISLKSCEENELAVAEGLHLKEGTYYLHTDNNDGLLDLFLPKTAGWTMGYIDLSLLAKPYYVEDTEVDNGYNFLYTTVQNMFECIVEPDIIKRTISVYSRVYYAEHHLTDIHIAKYNLLKHRIIEENDEDKYTALNVQGKDENLEIRAVNPTGKNVIYDFKPRYSLMSSALQQAIEKWQEKCESVEDEYLTLQQGYYAELETLFNEEQNIEVLKGELKTLEETRDAVIITVGDQQSTALNNVNAQIAAKQEEINTATSDYNSHKNTVQANYEVPISQINSDCALDLTAKDIDGNIIFTADLLNELMTHIKPTDYVDEYMLVTESMTYPEKFEKAKELMDRAKSQLVKISSGQKTYSVDTRSFLFNKHFKHFSEQLCAGAIIYVETKKDTMEQLHLTGIDINFDEKSANLTLGNKYDRSDLKALYDEALGQNSKSFSELKYIAGIIEEQQKQLNYQRNWVADLRTLTLDNVLTSEDQAIEINNRGLIGRKRQLNADGSWKEDENGNPLFELEQVKLINNTLVFTKDNWNTASTAVGKIAVGYNSDGSVKYSYGINGQVLIGELILGNNLVLTGTGAGIKIKDGNGNDAFYADDNGNLVLSGTIFANSGKIGNLILSNSKLFSLANSTDSYVSGLNGYFHNNSNNTIFLWAGARGGEGVSQSDTEATFGAYDWSNAKSIIEKTAKFYVTQTGDMYAQSGNIGGWFIDQYGISKTSAVSQTVKSTVAIWALDGYYHSNNSSRAADVITVQVGDDYPFSLWKDGTLNCTKANIEGTITANFGSVGGWQIKGGRIYNTNSTTGYTFSLWNPAIASGNILSCDNGSDYPFYVTRNGFLKATNAEIKGTISASKGNFGAWSLINWGNNYGCLYTKDGYNHNVYLGNIDVSAARSDGDRESVSWDDIVFTAYNYSDQMLKKDIASFNISHDMFFDLIQPKEFRYNNRRMSGSVNKLHLGFIYQNIVDAAKQANINDLALHWLKPDGYGNIDKQEIIALNTWQIQKLKKRASAAETRIMNLEATVAELKAQLQTLTAG